MILFVDIINKYLNHIFHLEIINIKVKERKNNMKKFNEWMSFRQEVEPNGGDYNFIGTYNTENLQGLKEKSNLVEIDKALEFIPNSYRNQFSDAISLSAGITQTEQNKEIVWITNNDQEITYLFEKN